MLLNQVKFLFLQKYRLAKYLPESPSDGTGAYILLDFDLFSSFVAYSMLKFLDCNRFQG